MIIFKNPAGLYHIQEVAKAIRNLSTESESIRLPSTNIERVKLAQLFVDERMTFEINRYMPCILPVCPDYGEGDQFHSIIKTGISREARAAINAVNAIHNSFSNVMLNMYFLVLIADTETDSTDILGRCANGDREKYLKACQDSTELIKREISPKKHVVVTTFSQRYGSKFIRLQNDYERLIRQKMTEIPKLRTEIEQVGQARKQRHSQILGREEKDYELTIRYMAQYAALGILCRGGEAIIVNYPTPNKGFINADLYKGLILSFERKPVIPVFESVLPKK